MIVLVLKYLYNILEYAGMGCNRLCIAGNGLQQPWAENAENAENGWKGFKIAWNCLKWMEMNQSSWTWLESPWNCLKSLEMAGNGLQINIYVWTSREIEDFRALVHLLFFFLFFRSIDLQAMAWTTGGLYSLYIFISMAEMAYTKSYWGII